MPACLELAAGHDASTVFYEVLWLDFFYLFEHKDMSYDSRHGSGSITERVYLYKLLNMEKSALAGDTVDIDTQDFFFLFTLD